MGGDYANLGPIGSVFGLRRFGADCAKCLHSPAIAEAGQTGLEILWDMLRLPMFELKPKPG